VRSPAGVWSPLYKVTDVDFNPTRPLCLLDEAARRVYVFYSLDQSAIYYKVSDLDSIAFPDGRGTPFIVSTLATDSNNPTSTKPTCAPVGRRPRRGGRSAAGSGAPAPGGGAPGRGSSRARPARPARAPAAAAP